MAVISSETFIHAPVERVWSILMDFDRYPEWNPFVSRIAGVPEAGQKLEVRLTPPGGMAMSFKPSVVRVSPQSEFRWLGHLLIKGIFDGEHAFELYPASEDGTRFVQSETFRGVLSAPLLLIARRSTERGFEAMNQALKQRAEGGTEP